MAKFLLLSHVDLWRVAMTNRVAAHLVEQGHEVAFAYSFSSEKRLTSEGLPQLREIRCLQERDMQDVFFPWLDKMQGTHGHGPLLTPHQLAKKYAGGNWSIIPSMAKGGNSGQMVESTVATVDPDYVISLDTYAFVPPSVLQEYSVIGIHPGPLPETRGSQASLRQILAKKEGGLVTKGTVHLLGKTVDHGKALNIYSCEYQEGDSPFQIRHRIYQRGVDVLLSEVLPQLLEKGIGSFSCVAQPAEQLPNCTPEGLDREFISSGRGGLFRYEEVVALMAQFLPAGVNVAQIPEMENLPAAQILRCSDNTRFISSVPVAGIPSVTSGSTGQSAPAQTLLSRTGSQR